MGTLLAADDFFRAAQLGDLDAQGALLAADPSLARCATLYDRLSALHIAAANGRLDLGDVDALGALLGADPSLAQRATLYDRLSALHIAAANGRLDLGDVDALGALLGADPSLAQRATLYDRLSALHIAAANGRLECIMQAKLCADDEKRVYLPRKVKKKMSKVEGDAMDLDKPFNAAHGQI